MKTKFFTGVGDEGVTNTGKNQLAKDDPVFMLLGSLDECNSWLGLVKVVGDRVGELKKLVPWVVELQEMLFVAQAEVATVYFGYGSYGDESRKFPHVKLSHLQRCEEIIHEIDAEYPQLTTFILPGGSEFSAQIDICRTIARKAERYAVIVSRKTELSADLLAFLNRLSSVLFAIARDANYNLGIKESQPSYK